MKLAVFIFLVVALPFQAEAGPCTGKTVEVWVGTGNGLTGDTFSNPEPYVKVQIGDIVRQTRVVRSSPNPSWWQRFLFRSPSSEFMRIEVLEEDTGNDDQLGTCMEQLVSEGNRFRPITCNVKDNGVVKLFYKCY